ARDKIHAMRGCLCRVEPRSTHRASHEQQPSMDSALQAIRQQEKVPAFIGVLRFNALPACVL
ncbi:hypothetical protein, partial [Stenotrophomonas maltophilia]|uniref:hypothetical protein n=1 Tax=Stenotrophomonas maltophilia TaxID=40324 RepID=UPI00195377F3